MEQNIEEGNKLIAEFMGYKLITPDMRREPEKWYIKGKPSCYWENPLLKGCKRVLCGEFQLSYHYSWDELMPVVEKIESIHTNDDCRHKGYELCMNGKIDVYFLNPSTGETVVSVPFCDFDDNNSQPMPTIEAVWLAVVEFIKWYNNQQSK